MSCEICKRGACTRSFHSIKEQDEYDAYQDSKIDGETFDEWRERMDEDEGDEDE